MKKPTKKFLRQERANWRACIRDLERAIKEMGDPSQYAWIAFYLCHWIEDWADADIAEAMLARIKQEQARTHLGDPDLMGPLWDDNLKGQKQRLAFCRRVERKITRQLEAR